MQTIINRTEPQDIIVTVGPSSYDSFSIQRMDELGATCFRINLSHTELPDFVPIIEKMEDWTDKPICPDTQGYQFRPRNVSAFTDKDLAVFRASKGLNVHTVFLSFCSYPEDVVELRSYFEYETTVIAKIENAEGLRNLPSILEVADGILIDRGDLSKDVPLWKIAYAQDYIISEAVKVHTPVSVATNLMESMMSESEPTRAEVNDIVKLLDVGVSGLVLAGETAIGKHPVKVVQFMKKIIDGYGAYYKCSTRPELLAWLLEK